MSNIIVFFISRHVQDQNLQTSDFSTKDQYINTTDSNSIQVNKLNCDRE